MQFSSKVVANNHSTTTMRPVQSAPYTPELIALVAKAEIGSPVSPHKPFLVKLVRLTFEATGTVYAEKWYRKLLEVSSSKRRPSTRTVNAVVSAAKEANGMAAGPTQATVKTLKAKYEDMASLVARMEAAVDRLAKICDRQLQISESLDRRQQVFSDQAQTYQRQIDGLAEIVKTQAAASREASRAASEIGLQAARAIRDLQASFPKSSG